MHFVVIFGPPAVGKMTVGDELAKLTGFKLFHNHMTVEPISEIFEFGSPPFGRLVNEIRRRVIEEVADSDLPGLVFTFVWAVDDPADKALVGSYADIVRSRGGTVSFVELAADLDERLVRNATELRLEHKRSHRDKEFSRNLLIELDEGYRMNTEGEEFGTRLFPGEDFLKIENDHLSTAEVAERILQAFGLTG
jgi:hypothetical protein